MNDLMEGRNMKAFSIFCVLIFLLSSGGEAIAETQKVEVKKYSFEGVVEKIVMRGQFEGTAIAVGVDPRFIIVVKDVKAVAGDVPAATDERLTYFIHSVAKTFASGDDHADLIGKKYVFEVHLSEKGQPYFVQATRAE